MCGRAAGQVSFLLTLLAFACLTLAAPRARAVATAGANVTLNYPTNNAVYFSLNGTDAYVTFDAWPVGVTITGASPGSQLNCAWEQELTYTTSLGTGKTLVDYDDAGTTPATTDGNGDWHHYAHNDDTHFGLLHGATTILIGAWIAKARSYLVASPTGGGNQITKDADHSHSFSVTTM